jgi:hypothetical protein
MQGPISQAGIASTPPQVPISTRQNHDIAVAESEYKHLPLSPTSRPYRPKYTSCGSKFVKNMPRPNLSLLAVLFHETPVIFMNYPVTNDENDVFRAHLQGRRLGRKDVVSYPTHLAC